jgi:lipid-binding SYLF domain-containing protein
MNENGVNSLLKSKVTLGADIGVTAGPVGRDASASTDALLGASILSYARSEGIFAGVDFDGAVLSYDEEATKEIYGYEWDVNTLLLGEKTVASNIEVFTRTLSKYALQRMATGVLQAPSNLHIQVE